MAIRQAGFNYRDVVRFMYEDVNGVCRPVGFKNKCDEITFCSILQALDNNSGVSATGDLVPVIDTTNGTCELKELNYTADVNVLDAVIRDANIVIEETDGEEHSIPLSSINTDLQLTTDGTATGVTLSGDDNHTADITITSTDTDNIGEVGTDGGTKVTCESVNECVPDENYTSGIVAPTVTGDEVEGDHYEDTNTNQWYVFHDGAWRAITTPAVSIPTETPLAVTTDGTATGVAQSGTANHTADITVTSEDTDNIGEIGTDGGTKVTCEAVNDCVPDENYTEGSGVPSVNGVVEGDHYKDTDTDTTYVWHDNAWRGLGAPAEPVCFDGGDEACAEFLGTPPAALPDEITVTDTGFNNATTTVVDTLTGSDNVNVGHDCDNYSVLGVSLPKPKLDGLNYADNGVITFNSTTQTDAMFAPVNFTLDCASHVTFTFTMDARSAPPVNAAVQNAIMSHQLFDNGVLSYAWFNADFIHETAIGGGSQDKLISKSATVLLPAGAHSLMLRANYANFPAATSSITSSQRDVTVNWVNYS